jgi:hypothetical protein
MDWRDVLGSLPRPSEPSPSQESVEPAVESPRVSSAEPHSFAERVRIAEHRLNACEGRMEPGMRDALRHSVEYLRDLVSGYRDEEVSERMLTAFEAQLRREMARRLL